MKVRYNVHVPGNVESVFANYPADSLPPDSEPPRPLPNHLPPLQFPRRPDESVFKAAQRLLDIYACGD